MIHLQAGHYLKHFNLYSLILSTLQTAVEWSEVKRSLWLLCLKCEVEGWMQVDKLVGCRSGKLKQTTGLTGMTV